MTETKYQRQKRRREAQGRHAKIVNALGSGFIQTFDQALEEYTPPCRESTQTPNPWTDWDRYPHNREPYETRMPTAKEARGLCEPCPLKDMCLDYALSTGQSHGVWGGKRISDGTILSDGINSPDMPNRDGD